MNYKDKKVIKELKSDLFYQISAKHGSEKASKYPSIKEADELLENENVCRVCGDETKTVFNIQLKAVPVCEHCANNIFMQQASWLGQENFKNLKNENK